MCSGNSPAIKNNCSKQNRRVYTAANGCRMLKPKKSLHWRSFLLSLMRHCGFFPPSGVQAPFPAGITSRIQGSSEPVTALPVKPFARQREHLLPGDWGAASFEQIFGASAKENTENRFVCTAKHCLPLQKMAEEEARLITRRRR